MDRFNLKNIELSLPLFFSIILSVSFCLLVPILEWPDAIDHIERTFFGLEYYPPEGLFSSVDQLIDYPSASFGGYFSDGWKYRFDKLLLLINFERLPYVLSFLCILYYFAKNSLNNKFIFAPPVIYSICAPSQEAFSIVLLILALFVSDRYRIVAIIFAILSTIVDRSMVPSAFFLVVYISLPFVKAYFNNIYVCVITLVSLAAFTFCVSFADFLSGLPALSGGDSSSPIIYGMSIDDALYTARYGNNKFFALVASVLGLYGWMTIRPFPFFIYYPIMLILFVFGTFNAKKEDRGFFTLTLLVTIVTLWIFPSLSQARYYPLLTMSAWGLVYKGSRIFGIKPLLFYSFVTISTVGGLFVSMIKSG